ncbi:MAG: lysyl oxidase family protein [Actinomycetota bacterium]
MQTKPSLLRTLVAALLMAAVAVPALAGPRTMGRLEQGDSVFWNGPYIKNSESGCDGCRYHLVVAEAADRLRVAIDFPAGNDFFGLKLIDPSGRTIRPNSSGFYSREALVKDPKTGTWTVVVQAQSVTKSSFRARAKLEMLEKQRGDDPLLPNLRTEPPFDFTFETDTIMVSGAAVGGAYQGTCSPDEMVEEEARRCLRFTVGPQNAGDGPLELRFSPAADALGEEAPMYQVITHEDGSTSEQQAGTYEYHKTHAHYHFTGFARLELFRVEGKRLEEAGTGRKSGFCFGDVMMNSWDSFIQERAGTSRSSCSDVSEAYMGLTRGWTDVYDHSTPGNYIEFTDQPDGLYVVRSTVDGTNVVKETNERDNTSYAYVHVQGDKIHLLERGYGMSPFDPNKIVARDWVARLRR